MSSQNSSLLSILGKLFTSLDVLLFSIATLLIFITFTYLYNQKFPNHKYPVLLEFLSFIA
ncbi:lipase [Bacillus cereus]|nr:lipase [Bacillus cereus]